MKYYVTADVHGYFTELKTALAEQGFFEDTEPHKLVICGDLYDRGTEALQLQEFILDLLSKDQAILIRGNHEDLALDLLHNWSRKSYLQRHHNLNGTVDTVCQLTGFSERDVYTKTDEVGKAFLQNSLVQTIIPAMVDYFETEHYIFVHGWIPCTPISLSSTEKEYVPIPDWRNADKEQWDQARWINGMEAAHASIIEPGKTVVCGHWHCSFGHAHYERDGSEFGSDANFTPYRADGIIALDACTARSGKVNCIVIED
jgi:serine/threonine protein phosphatase 1